MPKDGFLLVVLIAVLIISAVVDYRLKKIPNIITYPTMALAVGFHSFTNGGNGLYFSLSGLVAGIAFLILPYFLGGMGAGDAKLMGAVGAVVGPREVLVAFVYSALVGGVYALLLILIMRQRFRKWAERIWAEIKILALTHRYESIPAHPDERSAPKLCYGIAISIGTLIHILLKINGHSPINL